MSELLIMIAIFLGGMLVGFCLSFEIWKSDYKQLFRVAQQQQELLRRMEKEIESRGEEWKGQPPKNRWN